jgi:hypothetical protein
MSNRVHVEPTEFKDVRTGEISYGVRIWDDAAMTYDNSWGGIPNDDREIIRKVIQTCDVATRDMLGFVEENETGLYVGPAWYYWEDIKVIWGEGWGYPEGKDDDEDV